MTNIRHHRASHSRCVRPDKDVRAASDPAPLDAVPGVDAGDFIDQTVAVWQPYSSRALTREDGREIAVNIAGFFRVLQEWNRAEQLAGKTERQPAEKKATRACADVPK